MKLSRIALIALATTTCLATTACNLDDEEVPEGRSPNTPSPTTPAMDTDMDVIVDNNTTANNTTPNTTPDPDPDMGNMDPVDMPDPVDPRGNADFTAPAEQTTYASSTVDITVQIDGDAENVELVLDDNDVIHTFAQSGTFTWDVSGLEPGPKELALRYDLGGTSRFSFGERTIIVDHDAPELRSSQPVNMDLKVDRDEPFQLTFSEPMDPASITADTVRVSFNPSQPFSASTMLVDGGTTLLLDFDRSALTLPATIRIDLDGVTDLAGNTLTRTIGMKMPAWFGKTVVASLMWAKHFSTPNGEFVVGVDDNRANDTLRVFRRESNISWVEVASRPVSQTYGMDATQRGDRIVIALLHRGSAGQLILKNAQLFDFSTRSRNLTDAGKQGIGIDSPGGAISVAFREALGKQFGAVATVSGGRLRVYPFEGNSLPGSASNTFPSADFDHVRDEALSLHLKSTGDPEVVFARCATEATPCIRTFVERLSASSMGWAEASGTTATPISPGISNSCDEFSNFAVAYDGAFGTLLLPTWAPCNQAARGLRAWQGTFSGWNALLDGVDPFSGMPGGDTARFEVHAVVNDEGIHVLFATDTMLQLGTLGTNGFTWWAPAGIHIGATGATTLTRFRDVGLSLDEDGDPVILSRFGTNTYLWYSN